MLRLEFLSKEVNKQRINEIKTQRGGRLKLSDLGTLRGAACLPSQSTELWPGWLSYAPPNQYLGMTSTAMS